MASPGKKPFLLRVDPLLWDEIERLASAELRSVNAQVEYLLRDALRRRKSTPVTRAREAASPVTTDASPAPSATGSPGEAPPSEG